MCSVECLSLGSIHIKKCFQVVKVYRILPTAVWIFLSYVSILRIPRGPAIRNLFGLYFLVLPFFTYDLWQTCRTLSPCTIAAFSLSYFPVSYTSPHALRFLSDCCICCAFLHTLRQTNLRQHFGGIFFQQTLLELEPGHQEVKEINDSATTRGSWLRNQDCLGPLLVREERKMNK